MGFDEYKVQLEVFEGPLDLLLYLIKQDEVDIYDIPIVLITKQYMEYLDLMRMLNLDIAGDFIVMAATLMMIKSRMLLPKEEREDQDEEEEEDPRWDLVRRLVEYKKFKDLAGYLENCELQQENVFTREGEHLELGTKPERSFQNVGIFDLIKALNEALSRNQEEELGEIFAERFTVAEKIDWIVELTSDGGEISLGKLFQGMRSRNEIVYTFLAVLELTKLHKICITQESPFGDIVVKKVDGVQDELEDGE